jgi:3-oxoacyl-[acyl-carrier-protein] synthase-3
MNCYITGTGAYLPGPQVDNESLPEFMGELDGETELRTKILRMNGIKHRHYALDREQRATHDLYDLAVGAVTRCVDPGGPRIGYLSAGSTNTPLVGPGISSILHSRLAESGHVDDSLEINSNTGICTSSAQALVNGCRAVASGDHERALCVGVEQPSEILKSSVIEPPDDRADFRDDPSASKWFMSVFLRSMLSDGAGAFMLERGPSSEGVSYRVDWTYSRSFANEAPLCMTLQSRSLLLSQDVATLSRHMKPCVRKLMTGAMTSNGASLSDYRVVLPHLSSFYFRRYMLSVFKEMCREEDGMVDYWTNLEAAGNTGAASIFIMLDEYTRKHPPEHGEKVLLFIPESGQFNFVVISLTVVRSSS